VTWLLGVLLASLAGSVHCAAMCGAFVCGYARGAGTATVRSHAAYNLGRLTSYLLLGAVAGALGARVNDLGAFVGIGRAATVVAGACMIAWALNELALLRGMRWPARGVSLEWPKRLLGALLLRVRGASPTRRALALGLLTTLLPCGWLAAFVVTAAASGTAAAGATVMLVFWMGTVPLLVGIGVGVQRFGGWMSRQLPVAAAAIVLLLGVLSVAGRLRPPHPMASHAVGMTHGLR